MLKVCDIVEEAEYDEIIMFRSEVYWRMMNNRKWRKGKKTSVAIGISEASIRRGLGQVLKESWM